MKDILNKFNIPDTIISINENKIGLINTTYIVSTINQKYILQKINKEIFHSPKDLMNNIYIITNYLKDKNCNTLEIIKSKNEKLYVIYKDQYWRVFKYIEGKTFLKAENFKILKESALELAKFHQYFNNYSNNNLVELIPNFHNTPFIFKQFQNTLKHTPKSKLDQCDKQIRYILSKEKDCNIIYKLIENKQIPLQLCHNDPKISNFLFDKEMNVICLLDLDTIFYGTILTDIADAIRTMCVSSSENESDLDNLSFNYNFFKSFIESYLSKNNLNDCEINHIAKSIELIFLEQGIRFLTDYLNGNIYFKVDYLTQNLVRSNNQLYLSKEIASNLEKLNNIVQHSIK